MLVCGPRCAGCLLLPWKAEVLSFWDLQCCEMNSFLMPAERQTMSSMPPMCDQVFHLVGSLAVNPAI